jgi:hypothetical protein
MNIFCLAIASLLSLTAVESGAGECQDHNWDIYKVAKARQQGLSKQTLLDHLKGAQHELTPERIEKIVGMIDDVYKLDQNQEEEWFMKNRRECKDEKKI